MEKISRRQLLQRASAGAALVTLGTNTGHSLALPPREGSSPLKPSFEWIRSVRLMIAEGYAPPFYPSLDYDPEKALDLARRVKCNAIRFPTYSYVAYFPTQTKLPHHPELGDRDPFRRTVDLFHAAGLKVVAYNPLNHPFMDVRSDNPLYRDWMRYDADGHPYVTRHMGWTTFNEGCLNSPLREEIQKRVREVVTNYAVDLMYFDGPYQGMDQRLHYCHCQYCRTAYLKARGKSIPLQNADTTWEDDFEYQQWLTQDVVENFFLEICEMVRQVREVPIVYNDTGLLGLDWRSRAFRYVDGFMFEAADTPEQKLFNLRIGQSTGKVIWTYISSHTEYNREHLKDKTVRGWYSAPVEGERLQLDAAVATAASAGYCYWGLNRLFYEPKEVQEGPWVNGLKSVLEFAGKHEALLQSVSPQPQAGILTGTQTIQWYKGEKFVPENYRNYFYGAYQLLKDLSYDAEPFLDFEMTAERLAKYLFIYVPNAPCLSDAQCSMLTEYVEDGGTLLATHLTSVADELGRLRKNYGLADLFGATLNSAEPVEIPDLYLRTLPSRHLIPQDPQVMMFQAAPEAEVMAETYDRGHRRTLGPAIITQRHGKGRVIYVGSGLEAVYEETLNESLRECFQSLLDPILGMTRTYAVEYRPGLSCQFASSRDTLLLHLFANTGNIWKKLLVQESFLPIENVRVSLRLPPGRTAKSAALLWSGVAPSWNVRNGWVELSIPEMHPYEVVYVDIQS
jgi:hypothetical protein